MKRNRICELLGIEHPIIQGGMTWISNAELAAAVSNAGGFGIIVPNAGMELDGDLAKNLTAQIRKVKSLTDKPFGVNFTLTLPNVKQLMDIAIQEGVQVVETSAGNPALYTSYLKDAGIKVLHKVASVRHAMGAEARGADAVIAEGYEAGGHIGFDELPTMVLVPQVVDAVDIPVVAAGGIADARGYAAALALGAEGVLMGTRFIATHECIAHPRLKEAVVKAVDTRTVLVGRKVVHCRMLKSEMATRLLEMEAGGASSEEITTFIGRGRSRAALLKGDFMEGEPFCGATAGLITDIISAEEVVRSLVEKASAILSKLH